MGADKLGHGFVMSDGQVTTIDAPGSPTFTNVTNIDSRGEMVGRYTVNGVTHAYLLSGGEFNGFDYPGGTFTGATAISSRGDIVGRYRDANNVRVPWFSAGGLSAGVREWRVVGASARGRAGHHPNVPRLLDERQSDSAAGY
jgi:uncharacterized membrane protein